MEIIIRRLTTTSAEQQMSLADLLVATVNDGASVGFLPPMAMATALAFWQALPDERTILLVAEAGGRIVGTVQGQLAAKANGRHRAEIGKLLVHPDARRRGIARQLMVAVEAELGADGRTLIVLDTRDGDPSNALYRGMGYVEAGRIPDYARSAGGDLHTTVFYYKRLPVPGTTTG